MLFPDAMCIIAIFCGTRVAWGAAARASGSLADFFSLLTVEQLGCANAVCLHSTQKLLARLSYFGRGYAKSRKSAVCTLIGLHKSSSKIVNGAEIHGDASFHTSPFSFPMTEEMERVTSSALAKEWESICEVRRRAHKLRLVSQIISNPLFWLLDAPSTSISLRQDNVC